MRCSDSSTYSDRPDPTRPVSRTDKFPTILALSVHLSLSIHIPSLLLFRYSLIYLFIYYYFLKKLNFVASLLLLKYAPIVFLHSFNLSFCYMFSFFAFELFDFYRFCDLFWIYCYFLYHISNFYLGLMVFVCAFVSGFVFFFWILCLILCHINLVATVK